jgi:hypothetical protein
MALVNIIIADKLTGDTLTAGEFNQVKNGVIAAIDRINEFEGDLGSFGTSLTNLATITESVETNLQNKVEVIPGKGLSTNDFTTEEKAKLAALEEGGGGGVVIDTQVFVNTFDYNTSINGELFLTAQVASLIMQNVPNGGSGKIAIKQDATGGWGVNFVEHQGLTVQFLAGQSLESNNINAEPNGHTLVDFVRLGTTLYISHGPFAEQVGQD